VSEILTLRRDLDSKNHLVENLETSLSTAKTENDALSKKYADSSREVRKAKQAVQQMEKGTLEAVEDLVKDRDEVHAVNEDLRSKLEALQKKVRQQDEDAARTQTIWENEKEAFDSERRQLERRLHVTESRLRAFVDEMTAQQSAAAAVVHIEEPEDEVNFKDSALGNDSDTASIHSATTPMKPVHERNGSVMSMHSRNVRGSIPRHLETPEPIRPAGNSLADELGFDEEDDDFDDGFDPINEEDEYNLATPARQIESRQGDHHRSPRVLESRQSARSERFQRGIESRQGLRAEPYNTPKRNSVGATSLESPTKSSFAPVSPLLPPPNIVAATQEPVRKVVYVDRGYQPSPPPSPPRLEITSHEGEAAVLRKEDIDDDVFAVKPASISAAAISSHRDVGTTMKNDSRISSEASADNAFSLDPFMVSAARSAYTSTSTQTDTAEPETIRSHRPKQDSLSPASFVPAIAIHPPSSRPSSPRPAVLPPGTKNASAQTDLPWPGVDASMQTEPIRVDKRAPRLAAHLLPSPPISDATLQSKRASVKALVRNISIRAASGFDFQYSPPMKSPDSSRENTRDGIVASPHAMPLKAMPLPRPVLSPPATISETISNGPLNRSAEYGVKQTRKMSVDGQPSRADDTEGWSDNNSDYDDLITDLDLHDIAGGFPASMRAAATGVPDTFDSMKSAIGHSRQSSHGKRPTTASSYGAAPAPSVSSSRAPSRTQMFHSKRGSTSNTKGHRSRSPSFASAISSSYSTQSVPAVPPYPIPLRSSSKTNATPLSDGTASPTPGSGSNRYSSAAQAGLRKVQSAAIIRGGRNGASSSRNPSSPTTTKIRRRRLRSPDLTPVQSMAFDSPPIATDFPIPDLPIPLIDGSTLDVPAPLTMQEVIAPVPQVIGPMSPVTTTTNHITASAAAAAAAASQVEPPNLVDAIAATMVGEWMWKYIRKRKSFGIGEDSSAEISVPMPPGHQHAGSSTGSMGSASTGNNTLSIQAHGTRHKRWVWLSPYERTIMWDTKQPTSGQALLGKKGRKLAIQSVLDVQDPTPLPAKPELRSAFARSILILTPERALKFTAVDLERHMLWMTALTFLAQNNNTAPHGVPMSPTMPSSSNPAVVPHRLQPPPAPSESNDGLASPTIAGGRERSPSFGRSNVRDSIRLAKAKGPEYGVTPVVNNNTMAIATTVDMIPTDHHHEASAAAEPPSVPRLYITTSKHQRKRSNTLGSAAYHPRLPSSIRNFSSPTPAPIIIPKSNASVTSNGPQSAGLSAPSPSSTSYYSRSGTGTAATYMPKTYHAINPSYSSYAYSGTASTTSNSGYLSDHHTTQTSSSRHHRNSNNSNNSGSRKSGSVHTTTTSPTAPNFFEAVGTVRMEAFVDRDDRQSQSSNSHPDFHAGMGMFGGGIASNAPIPGVARSYTDKPASTTSSTSNNNNMLYIPAGMPFNQASSGLRYQTGAGIASNSTGATRPRGDSLAGSSTASARYRDVPLTATQAAMQLTQQGFVFDDGNVTASDPFKGF
jgi:hypothetical protein